MKTARKVDDTPKTHPATPAWLSVVRAYHLCEERLAQRISTLGIDIGTHEVLVNLSQTSGLSQQELARRCFTTKSNISMLLKRIERDGLIERHVDPDDARARQLALTQRGRSLAAKCMAIQYQHIDAMLADCNDAEISAVADAMNKVSGALRQMATSR